MEAIALATFINNDKNKIDQKFKALNRDFGNRNKCKTLIIEYYT
jgi:hypothetical protein